MTALSDLIARLEAAVASARETALEEAQRVAKRHRDGFGSCEALGPMDPETGTQECSLENNHGTCPCAEQIEAAEKIIAAIDVLKSTPPAPATLSATKEVMPDTSGPRSNSGDNATPQASTLAPGADALIDRNALIDLLAKIEDGPYLGAEGVADAVIELLLPNLIRAQGGKP